MSVPAHLSVKATDYRRHRRRQERHAARVALRQVIDGYVDADDLALPVLTRDVGKHLTEASVATEAGATGWLQGLEDTVLAAALSRLGLHGCR